MTDHHDSEHVNSLIHKPYIKPTSSRYDLGRMDVVSRDCCWVNVFLRNKDTADSQCVKWLMSHEVMHQRLNMDTGLPVLGHKDKKYIHQLTRICNLLHPLHLESPNHTWQQSQYQHHLSTNGLGLGRKPNFGCPYHPHPNLHGNLKY